MINCHHLPSQLPESISSESENRINDEQVPSTISPTKLAMSPVSELMNEETVSGNDDKKTVPDESMRIVINSITYDYLPQGKRFTFVTYMHFII
jgi:hypothetical protein